MKWKLLSLGAFLFFLFGACNKQENPEGMFLKFKSMTNEALLEKAQTNIDVTELRPLKLVLLQRSEQEASWLYIDSIIEALKIKAEGNAFKTWTALTIERSLAVERGQLDKALQIARSCLSMQGMHDSIEIADLYHDLGITFMHLHQADSITYYWKRAYLRTEEKRDYKRLTVTAFNLAAHYHNLGLYDLSRKLFARTIEIMEKLGKKSPLLVNNLISTLIAREKYDEADRYWKKHAEELDLDIQSYPGQVIKLNRAVLSGRLKKYHETDSILKLFKTVEIDPLLHQDYLQTLILQSLRLQSESLSDMRYVHEIPDNIPFLLNNNYEGFSEFMLQKNWKFLQDTLYQRYQVKRMDSNYDPRYLFVMSKYLASKNRASSPLTSVSYFQDMIEHQKMVDSVKFKNDQIAIGELTDYEMAMSQLASKNLLLESSKNREIMYFVIFLLVLILLSLGFYSVRQKLNVSAERSIWLEKQKEQADELILSNQRLVEYSKVILERNNHIKQRLNKLELKGKSAVVVEIKNIIKDLDVMNKVNTKEKPQIADNLIEKTKENDHPELTKLSRVEQRIYVLSQNNYRPKDIANMLGYSVQYVRNVKSRIVKKIEGTKGD